MLFSQVHRREPQPLLDRERRIRTLGWDCLNVRPEVLVAAITDAVSQLGFSYELQPPATVVARAHASAHGADDEMVVIFIVQHSENDLLCLDIRRLRGDSFRFHAFYRDVRKALSAINGWDEVRQAYVSDADVPLSPPRRVRTLASSLSELGELPKSNFTGAPATGRTSSAERPACSASFLAHTADSVAQSSCSPACLRPNGAFHADSDPDGSTSG